MTMRETLRAVARVFGAACFAVIGGAILFITVASIAEPADAQEPLDIDFWYGEIIPPPPEIVIERVLYADAGDANAAFDCATPTTAPVDGIEDARWACYSITNTGTAPVSTFTLSDTDMRPSHTYVPVDPDVDSIAAGETLLHQVEVSPFTAAFISDPGDTPVSYVDQRALWESLDIDDYQMDLQPWCFCFFDEASPPPYRITVVDGSITDAVSIETGNPAPLWTALTIDDVHDRISTAIDPADPAWQAWATIDTDLGIPTTWFIDEEMNIADEEFGGAITNFIAEGVDNAEPAPTGDVNCSGRTDIIDALLVALYDSQLTVDLDGCPVGGAAGVHAAHGDINGDGQPNIIDALLIARCSTGLPSVHCDNLILADLD